MMKHNDTILNELECNIVAGTSREDVLGFLRKLSFSDFGELLFSLPNSEYPKISTVLPAMASVQTQMNWTGASGERLLSQSIDFVRSVAYNYSLITGKSLKGADILDYGCGYGRIARLMYYFTPEKNFFGVDPWDKSIEECNSAGLTTNFVQSEFLPLELPVGDQKFDLAFAFSVFTHLSERANKVCLRAMAKYLKENGLLVITVRAVEHWKNDIPANEGGHRERLEAEHETKGFAYLPYNIPPVDGEVIYGDTTLAFHWIEQTNPDLKIAGIDRSLSDPTQIYVFLRKRT